MRIGIRHKTRTAALLALLAAAPVRAAPPGEALSLLTYNVKGLPWPVAAGRKAALVRIADRLRTLRGQGRQPHLVALQEAFTPAAKAIGSLAGYRYAAFGPGQDEIATPTREADRAFAAAGSYWSGEREGKRADSGLAIFSDYPILAVRRLAYANCAGFDCLANKGAVATLIAVPGLGPVILVDTHLNASAASGTSKRRALYAYERQIDAFTGFVAMLCRSSSPLLVAGDFNVGHNVARRAYVMRHLVGAATPLANAEPNCVLPLPCPARDADIMEALQHGKDWLLFRSTLGVSVRPAGLSAMFGHGPGGVMLSDHIGLYVAYRFSGVRGNG